MLVGALVGVCVVVELRLSLLWLWLGSPGCRCFLNLSRSHFSYDSCSINADRRLGVGGVVEVEVISSAVAQDVNIVIHCARGPRDHFIVDCRCCCVVGES